MDVYVLNKNLEIIGIVDSYKSLIWSNRYNELGDCEIYIEASITNINLLQKDYYLMRLDDSMVCQIKKIELDSDSEDGDYLIVSGYDVKGFLDQRIIWSTMTCNGNVEDFIREMVNSTLINANLGARQLYKPNGQRLLYLGNKAGLTEVATEQVTYKNVGEKVREYCDLYGWGYRIVYSDDYLWFQLYNGTDISDSVIFSDEYENLQSTKYSEDDTNIGNVALVAGEGEGSERSRNVSGYAEGIERYEIYVDAKDISKTITWEELTNIYPTTDDGGQGYISRETDDDGDVYYAYKLNYLNVQIIDYDQLTNLKTNYPDGQEITISGVNYYQVYNEIVADLPSNSPQDTDNVMLRPLVYEIYLLSRGYDKLAEYGQKISFEGSVEPNVTFVYKKDYFLGDIVTVENHYGLSASARITEIVEVYDNTGYSIEPKFEYLEIGDDTNGYIYTDESTPLLTQDGSALIVENSVWTNSSNAQATSGQKISQLPEAEDLDESYYMPFATDDETVKVSYQKLIDELREDIGTGGTTDYNDLINKPKIEGVTLEGDKTHEELNLQRISNSEIEDLLTL